MKTVLITGATAGIGEATARKLDKEGYRLILTGRRKDRLQSLQESLNVPTHTLCFDICDRESMCSSIDGLPSKFNEVDVLINNAGLAQGLAKAWEAKQDDWDTMIATNISGLVNITRYLLPGMVKRNCGHILNLGSIAGNYCYPFSNVYGGTKAFVHQFSGNLRADLVGKKVRVSTIAPGIVDTEFSVVRFKGDKSKAATVYKDTVPLIAEDVAEAICWCIEQPEHVNVSMLEIMPTYQANGPMQIYRE